MDEPYIGSIMLFPYTFIPAGWIECAGQTLNMNQYAALYSLLGTIYGGDGRTTFGIPNLKGAEPVPGTRYCLSTTGLYPLRP